MIWVLQSTLQCPRYTISLVSYTGAVCSYVAISWPLISVSGQGVDLTKYQAGYRIQIWVTKWDLGAVSEARIVKVGPERHI